MLILALDTTSEHGGVALFQESLSQGSISHRGSANEYAVALFAMVDQLLHAAGRGLRDVDLYAVANGPGSFTGIRVGLAAVQGWATAFNRPVCSVSVLEAMVEAAQPKSDLAVPLLDARRGEFYLDVFKRLQADGPSVFAPVGEGMALKPGVLHRAWLEFQTRHAPNAAITGIVREHDTAALALRSEAPAWLRWQTVSGTLLDAVAHRARRAYERGGRQSAAELDAYYLRRSDAELHLRES